MLPLTKKNLISILLKKADEALNPTSRLRNLVKEWILEDSSNRGVIFIAFAKSGENIASACFTDNDEMMVSALRATLVGNDKIITIFKKALNYELHNHQAARPQGVVKA